MVEAPPKKGDASYSLDDRGQIAVTYDVSSIIIVTEDRLRVRLMEHLAGLASKGGWIAPAGVLVTVVGTLATSTFNKDVLGLAGPVWNAVYVIAGLLAFIWLLIATFKAVRRNLTLDGFIDRCKADTATAAGLEGPPANRLPPRP